MSIPRYSLPICHVMGHRISVGAAFRWWEGYGSEQSLTQLDRLIRHRPFTNRLLIVLSQSLPHFFQCRTRICASEVLATSHPDGSHQIYSLNEFHRPVFCTPSTYYQALAFRLYATLILNFHTIHFWNLLVTVYMLSLPHNLNSLMRT